MSWLRLLDRLSPDVSKAPAGTLRARILVACSVLVVFWAPVYALFFFAMGQDGPAITVAVAGAVATGVLIWFRRNGNINVAGALIAFIALTVLIVLCAWFGGLSSPSLTWLPGVSLFGFCVGGRKTGWVISIVSAIAVVCLYVAEPSWAASPGEGMRAYLAFGLVTCVLLVLSLGLAYLSLFDRALLLERKATDELRRSTLELDAARREAVAASSAKSQFLANMSHEIRTPLNGVLGMIELARDTELSPRQREYLDTAHSSGHILLRLVNDLLDVSKLEATGLPLESVAFSAEQVTGDALTELAVSAARKGIELASDLDPAFADPVVGDPYRFRQLITNLVGNAIKFTQQGHVALKGRRTEAGLEVAISDTGIGMSSEEVERIFAPFVQADTSTTRRFGGTGLGLTICAELARRMGGSLRVESEPGVGSTFTLRVALPLARDAAPEDAQSPAPSPVADPPPAPAATPLRVLVAEDNAVNARLTQRLLEKLGHQVTVVQDGQDACASIDGGAHDLVLMDLHMPRMGGVEATREVRLRGQSVPIVALTASALECDVDACTAAGMDGFLSKPIRLENLAKEIARLTSREGA